MQSFTFITSVNEAASYDDNTKRQIRKRAMDKAALARKSHGKYGKHNLRQYPEGPECQVSKISSVASPIVMAAVLSRTIPARMADSGYELIKQKYAFHVVDLSALTTFHVTHGTVGCLADDPAVLTSILQEQQPSYLSHVPSRYGSCAALDAAVECVAARFQLFIRSPKSEITGAVSRLYLKALKALQMALDAGSHVTDADVLCAAELLGLYEVCAANFFIRLLTRINCL